MLKRDAASIDALAGSGTANGLADELSRYADTMAAHARDPGNEMLASTVRAGGNHIVTVGENLALSEHQSVDAALQAHQRNFLILLAVVAAILIATGILLARRVTRPLKAMENHMESVASGQLTRLTPDSRDREFVSLTDAFNHVLDELERREHTPGAPRCVPGRRPPPCTRTPSRCRRGCTRRRDALRPVTILVASMTSLPMPSPGSHAMRYLPMSVVSVAVLSMKTQRRRLNRPGGAERDRRRQ